MTRANQTDWATRFIIKHGVLLLYIINAFMCSVIVSITNFTINILWKTISTIHDICDNAIVPRFPEFKFQVKIVLIAINRVIFHTPILPTLNICTYTIQVIQLIIYPKSNWTRKPKYLLDSRSFSIDNNIGETGRVC